MLSVNSAKVNLGRREKLAFHVSSNDTMFARFYIGLMAGRKPRARAGAGMTGTDLTEKARICPSEGWRWCLVDRPHPVSYLFSDSQKLKNTWSFPLLGF